MIRHRQNKKDARKKIIEICRQEKKLGASRNEQEKYSSWVYIRIYTMPYIEQTLAVHSIYTVEENVVIPSLSDQILQNWISFS